MERVCGGRGAEMVRAIQPKYSVKLFGIVTMNPHCTTNIS
jgi:hypothetical protein